MALTLLVLILSATSGDPDPTLPVQLPHRPGDPGPVAAVLEDLLVSRESARLFSGEDLTLDDVSSVLWAACGILPDGRMTVPSAGALYPLEILLAAGDVDGLAAGLYGYVPSDGTLERIRDRDVRVDLAEACLGQPWVAVAPASLIICARPDVTTSRYGSRGERYVMLEAGHSSQNVYLMCTALGLGTVAVGAFDDSLAASVLMLDEALIPIYVMPFGARSAGVGSPGE
jgi:SagB-type dehydrogenase family enzyme